MPKISIIMPVYNKQDYLKRSLDSVLNQDFSDYELIVVDDGSKDESPKILDDYASKDPRIKVFHTENHGVSHARNTGLEKAEGDWIQFLDGDDLIEKDYLEKCQETLDLEDPDILFTSFLKVDEKGNELSAVEVPFTGHQNGEDLPFSFLDRQPKNGFYGYVSNKLLKRKLIDICNARFNEKLTLAEDLDFFVQCYPAVQKAYYLNDNSFRYLQTDENYSKRNKIDYIGQLGIQKRIRQWIIDSGNYNDHKAEVDGQVCRYASYAVFDAAATGESVSKTCEHLLNDEVVRNCLDENYVTNKIHKRIIHSLKNGKIGQLESFLMMRENIKKLLGRK